MATSALIVLDDEALPTRVLGIDGLEFVGRQLAREGVNHLVVCVDRVPRHLGGVLDRLRHDGVRCSLARSTIELAELFHPDEIIVLLTGTSLGDSETVRELAQAKQPSLLCVSESGRSSHERIDATTWWTGLGTISGALIRRVASVPGEWNLASTILRVAVQAGVERRCVQSCSLVDPHEARNLRRFEAMAVRHYRSDSDGWGTRLFADPVARVAGVLTAGRLARATIVARGASALLSLAAIASAFLGDDRRSTIAALCVVGAGMAGSFCRVAVGTIGSRKARPDIDARLSPYAAAAALLAITWRAGDAGVALTLAVNVIALTWLVQRGGAVLDSSLKWWPDVTGHALVIAGATALSRDLLIGALIAVAIHVFGCLAWLQRKVSKLLTQKP